MKQIVGVFKGPNIVHNYGVNFCFESQRKGLATRSNILLLEFGVITITWAGPGDFKITWAGPSDYNHFSARRRAGIQIQPCLGKSVEALWSSAYPQTFLPMASIPYTFNCAA